MEINYEELVKQADVRVFQCAKCGKNFARSRSAGTRTYCSRQCYLEAVQSAKKKAKEKKKAVTFVCKECGREKTVPSDCFVRDYCSKSCAANAAWKERRSRETVEDWYDMPYDPELTWKREHGRWICPYSDGGVLCSVRACTKCGWNPDVELRRSVGIIGRMILEGSV